MIDRLHLFKLREAHADAPTRQRLADAIRASLGPRGWELRIGLPADMEAAKAWDLRVELSFADDDEARAEATLHAIDEAFAAVRDRMAVEKHWSFVRH